MTENLLYCVLEVGGRAMMLSLFHLANETPKATSTGTGLGAEAVQYCPALSSTVAGLVLGLLQWNSSLSSRLYVFSLLQVGGIYP